MAHARSDREYCQRNHLSESNQAGSIPTGEKSGNQQEQADLETAAIDYGEHALDHHAREFAGVGQLRASQNAEHGGRHRGAKEKRRAQPQAQNQKPQVLDDDFQSNPLLLFNRFDLGPQPDGRGRQIGLFDLAWIGSRQKPGQGGVELRLILSQIQ
ncbi:MAG: hypothetical protein QOK48_52 [Blastocatellia bacterium]|nr:hypothetical protein [Blastocatellia bacterium]